MFLIYALMGLIGFGFADFFAVYLSKSTGHVKGMLWNTFFMVLFLIALTRFFSVNFLTLTPLTLITIVGAAILHTSGGLSFYKGTQVGKLSILSPIASTYSLVIVLLSLLLFAEKLTKLNIAAIALIILGTILISINTKDISNLKIAITDKSVPYGIMSMFFWGTGFILIGLLTKQFGWLLANIYVSIMSLILLTGISYIKHKSLGATTFKAYGLAVILGIFSMMGYVGYSLGTETGFTSIVGPVVAAAPIVTVILALVFLREKLAKTQLTGVILSVIGLALLTI